MHRSITLSLSQTIWPRWASRQFLTLPIARTLLPVTFAYAWKWKQGRSTLHSPKLQHYWNLTIRLLSFISRTLIRGVLPLCRDPVALFYSPNRLGNIYISMNSLLVTLLKNYLETMYLKWLNGFKYSYLILTNLSDFKYYYQTQIILFNINEQFYLNCWLDPNRYCHSWSG